MDDLFQVFFSAQTILLCMGVYMSTFVVRRIVESLFPKVRKAHYWLEIFVPIAPIANGALFGYLLKNFSWPEMVGEATENRVMFGAFCGLASGWVYNRIRAFMKAKREKEVEKAANNMPFLDSLPPAPESLRPLSADNEVETKVEGGGS